MKKETNNIRTCPKCGTETKAEQCDSCQYVPTIQDMSEGICLDCGSKTVLKDNKNLYLKLSAFQKEIEEHTEKSNTIWRLNAKNESIKMKEDSQEYAQQLLNNLEQDLNRLYQVVMNGQQRLQEMKSADSVQHMQ